MKNHHCGASRCGFLFSILTLTLLFSCNSEKQVSKENPDQEEWVAIFDGTNMSDWTPKFAGFELGVNHKNRFTHKDSLLSVRYSLIDTFKGNFGHLYYKDKFSHYKLRATYRFVGEQMLSGPGWAVRNNGLMLHCQDPKTLGLNQDFPISLEMQLLGGNGTDDRPTGNLCSPGTNVIMGDTLFTQHCISSSSKTYHGDQWVNAEALVLGDSLIQHIIEGTVVLEYSKPTIGGGAVTDIDTTIFKDGMPVNEGYISIQAETAPIDFKSIELLNLCGCMDKKAKNYKSYFVKADNSTCKY